MTTFNIYIVQNKLNGKCYVGKTINPADRYRAHFNNYYNSLIGRTIRKYGKENFEFTVIEEHSSEVECFEAEQFFIQYLQTKFPNVYNLTDGGENPPVNYGKYNFCFGKKGKLHPRFGMKRTWEPRLGCKHTEETKAAISVKLSGEKNHNFGKRSKRAMNIVVTEIVNNNFERHFDSITLADKYYNISKANISACLNGKRKSCKNKSLTFKHGELN